MVVLYMNAYAKYEAFQFHIQSTCILMQITRNCLTIKPNNNASYYKLYTVI